MSEPCTRCGKCCELGGICTYRRWGKLTVDFYGTCELLARQEDETTTCLALVDMLSECPIYPWPEHIKEWTKSHILNQGCVWTLTSKSKLVDAEIAKLTAELAAARAQLARGVAHAQERVGLVAERNKLEQELAAARTICLPDEIVSLFEQSSFCPDYAIRGRPETGTAWSTLDIEINEGTETEYSGTDMYYVCHWNGEVTQATQPFAEWSGTHDGVLVKALIDWLQSMTQARAAGGGAE